MLAVFAAALIVRVAEPQGAPLPQAVVTLVQGQERQVRRTGPSGEARFRCAEGPLSVELDPRLPAGWVLAGPPTVELEARFDQVNRAAFAVRARRSLSGRVFLDADGDGAFGPGDVPLVGVTVKAGAARAESDASGGFALQDLPPGTLRLETDSLLDGHLDLVMPQRPGEMRRDLPLRLERLGAGERASLRVGTVRVVPQQALQRPTADWASGKPLGEREAAALSRLCALTNLDSAFRLVMVTAKGDGIAATLRGASALSRYLTGPGLVPPERVALVEDDGNLARTGLLTLVLARVEEGGP